MNTLKVGRLCKQARLKKNISLVRFAQMNNENYKNIWAFENGKANNIKYLSYYYNLFDDEHSRKEFTKELFEIQGGVK